MILLSDQSLRADPSSLGSIDWKHLEALLSASAIAETSKASRNIIDGFAGRLEEALSAFRPTVIYDRLSNPINFALSELRRTLGREPTPFQEAQLSVSTARTLLRQIIELQPAFRLS